MAKEVLVCSVPYCDKPSKANTYCINHNYAFKKYGDPCVLKQKQHHGISLRDRFFLYTKKGDDCWDWIGHKDKKGYGRLNVDGIPMIASRLSYLVHFGTIPKGMCICHKCDRPTCVNPEHLFLGTQTMNVNDMHVKGRANKRGLKGSDHNLAKLTETQVRAIRAAISSDADLALEFGVSRPTVWAIRTRKTWRHID